jgi:surfeit locus 1 family protein
VCIDYALLMSYLQFRFADYRFRPSWLGTLITICCIPLFIKLGLWQYHKAEQKQVLQTQYDKYLHAPPVALPEGITQPEDWRYRHVKTEGEYEPRYQILLDNQVAEGQVGYHVITPLRIHNTQRLVLVDRGWIPAQDSHSVLPIIDTPVGEQEVTGQVWLPSSKFYSLEAKSSGSLSGASWQPLWQNMDMERYARSVPFPVLPLVIRLDAASSAGGFLREWPRPAERITTNIGYAYQWFGFAVTALAIYVFVSFKKIKE